MKLINNFKVSFLTLKKVVDRFQLYAFAFRNRGMTTERLKSIDANTHMDYTNIKCIDMREDT